jgi:hypothetical protein
MGLPTGRKRTAGEGVQKDEKGAKAMHAGTLSGPFPKGVTWPR